jgi:hypothetical protein
MRVAAARAMLEMPHRRRCIVTATKTAQPPLGLSEHELRTGLEEELVRAMRAEGGVPTVHAIAHSIARMLERDHLRIAEQLERAGIRL